METDYTSTLRTVVFVIDCGKKSLHSRQEAEMDKSTSILIIFGAVLALIFLMPILGAVSLIFMIPPGFVVAVNTVEDKLATYARWNEGQTRNLCVQLR